jgi:hypothetical protein
MDPAIVDMLVQFVKEDRLNADVSITYVGYGDQT